MAEVKKENWFKATWGKTCKFFRELRSELKKVVWPTAQQVLKNALIVAGCCLVIGVFTMRDCVKNLRDEMDAITKQLNEVEETVNNGLEQQLGEEAYQELCERLRGELLEELKQSAQTNTTEGSSGADCQ